MRIVNLRLLVVLFALVVAPPFGVAQQHETLKSVKQKYLNQTVVLIGQGRDDWFLGSESAGRYDADLHAFLSATYKGKIATVIAIQLDSEPSFREKTNALGESINPDDTVDPYFDFVIRFDDGQVAMTTAYPSTISDEVRFSSVQGALAQEMATKLPGVVGKSFFASGLSDLYLPSRSEERRVG